MAQLIHTSCELIGGFVVDVNQRFWKQSWYKGFRQDCLECFVIRDIVNTQWFMGSKSLFREHGSKFYQTILVKLYKMTPFIFGFQESFGGLNIKAWNLPAATGVLGDLGKRTGKPTP